MNIKNTSDNNIKIKYAYNDRQTYSLSITKTITVPLRRYGYLCNDSAITTANKLRDFQCKFANVRMNRIDI